MLFRAEDILIQQLPDESAELKIRKILNSNVEWHVLLRVSNMYAFSLAAYATIFWGSGI